IITPKVPAHEVKQRVMIVLQAELDINTEVQKRGRINRTGQILKPIYDYVNSAIPAEKRLMMMLQKKLKSLDANTTSNQKQSTKILDVPDFLNKYGDKIVKEYLLENLEINTLLNDPLKFNDAGKTEEGVTEDASHKVSGRVAVLSTKMQQDFYNEISSRYYDYVDYLKQISEYDLEVEAMDLQAEVIKKKIVKVGKGGVSEFGEDSILETVQANVLRKPFSRSELDNLITEALAGQDAKTHQQGLVREYVDYMTIKSDNDQQENIERYTELIDQVVNEKKIKKILEQAGESAWKIAVEERKAALKQALEDSEAKLLKDAEHKKSYLLSLFNFFYTGRQINYPFDNFLNGQELVPAVFLGYIMDRKKKNPFAPSTIRLRFALANSSKYIAIPASYSKDITSIRGASYSIRELNRETILTNWEQTVKVNTVDRKLRFIVTGNLLQAFSDYKGKLVSYTMQDGSITKGILMPEYWVPEDQSSSKVTVPILKALKIIRSMGMGSQVNTENGISLLRRPGSYKMIVPASKTRGGEYYLDAEILALVERNLFEKVSDKMVAIVPEDNIENL
ncbi:MAG: strawberry notch C-terminal domain-containing protein, partial [Bacteroidota bacterium]|nr:strawberry notch C-terminal domain-containing protein [Bacteroidota bacterium]